MAGTREQISEAVFNLFVDGIVGDAKELGTIQDSAVQRIAEQLELLNENRSFVDAVISDAICLTERNAFLQGFSIGVDFMSGKILREE